MTNTAAKPKRRGRPSRGESAELHNQIVKVASSNPMLTREAIGEAVGVSRQTVSEVLAKYGINKQELDEFVDNRVDIVREKQRLILQNITTEKVEKAPMRDLAVAYGILLDKDRLESGQSTSNVASWCRIVQESERQINDVQVIDK